MVLGETLLARERIDEGERPFVRDKHQVLIPFSS